MVAGTAPFSRMIFSTFIAVSTFCGYGMPWEMMVDSSATTGLPASRASLTSGRMSRYSFRQFIMILLFLSGVPSLPEPECPFPVRRVQSG